MSYNKNTCKIGEKRYKERLGDFSLILKSGEFPLQQVANKIWEETNGRWFEFEFQCQMVERFDGDGLYLHLLKENGGRMIMLFSGSNREIFAKSDFTLEEWVRQQIWDALIVESRLPKGCLAVYESKRIG